MVVLKETSVGSIYICDPSKNDNSLFKDEGFMAESSSIMEVYSRDWAIYALLYHMTSYDIVAHHWNFL